MCAVCVPTGARPVTLPRSVAAGVVSGRAMNIIWFTALDERVSKRGRASVSMYGGGGDNGEGGGGGGGGADGDGDGDASFLGAVAMPMPTPAPMPTHRPMRTPMPMNLPLPPDSLTGASVMLSVRLSTTPDGKRRGDLCNSFRSQSHVKRSAETSAEIVNMYYYLRTESIGESLAVLMCWITLHARTGWDRSWSPRSRPVHHTPIRPSRRPRQLAREGQH
jgi:hypothetical protein